MKTLLLILLWISTGSSNDPREIAKANNLKKMAEEAFQNQDYQQAAMHYAMLLDTMKVEDGHALLNMGHALFNSGDSTQALEAYQRLTASDDRNLKSLAYQQLGVLHQSPQDLKKSLAYFKQSLKANPANEEARYNYELVKKRLEQQQEQQDENEDNQDDNDQNEDQKENEEQQDNQDQQDQEQSEDQENEQNQEQEQEQENDSDSEEDGSSEDQQGEEEDDDQKEGEEQKEQNAEDGDEDGEENEAPQPSTSEKLEEMNLTEEKAQMILEALRNSEIQYIQQMRKNSTKAPDSKKPDW